MGTHLRVFEESFPMNTNIIGFRWFTKKNYVLVLWTKVGKALERLNTEATFVQSTRTQFIMT